MLYRFLFYLFFVFFLTSSHTLFASTNEVKLSMFDVIKTVLKNNFDVRVSEIENKSYKENLNIEYGKYDPVLSMAASVEEDRTELKLNVFQDPEDIYEASFGITKETMFGTELTLSAIAKDRKFASPLLDDFNTNLSLSLRQPIFNNSFGFQNRKNIEYQKKLIESFDLTMQYNIETTCLNALNLFYDYYLRMRYVVIQKDILKIADDFLKYNIDKEQYGAAEITDVLAAKANLYSRKVELISSENLFYKSGEELKLEINDYFDKDIVVVSEAEFEKPAFDIGLELAVAYKNRLDLASYIEELAAAGINVQIKDNNKLPDLDVVASAGALNSETELDKSAGDSTEFQHSETYVGIEFSYAWGNLDAKAKYKQAELLRQAIREKIEKLRKLIRKEVMNAVHDVVSTYDRYKGLKELLVIQQEKLDKEMEKYKTGRSNSVIIIDYQDDLLAARNMFAQASVAHKKALIVLEFRKGILV